MLKITLFTDHGSRSLWREPVESFMRLASARAAAHIKQLEALLASGDFADADFATISDGEETVYARRKHPTGWADVSEADITQMNADVAAARFLRRFA